MADAENQAIQPRPVNFARGRTRVAVPASQLLTQSDDLDSIVSELATLHLRAQAHKPLDPYEAQRLKLELNKLKEISRTIRYMETDYRRAEEPTTRSESSSSSGRESAGVVVEDSGRPDTPAALIPGPPTPRGREEEEEEVHIRRRPVRWDRDGYEYSRSPRRRDYYERERDRYRSPRSPSPPRFQTQEDTDESQDVIKVSSEFDMSHPDWQNFYRDHAVVAYYKEVPVPLQPSTDEGGSTQPASKPSLKRSNTAGTLRRQQTGGLRPSSTNKPLVIRINSKALVEELERFTTSGVVEPGPLILIPPYKFLFFHWEELKDSLAALTEKLQEVEPPDNSDDLIRHHRAFTMEAGMRRKKAQLSNFINFFQEEYGDYLSAMEGIRNGTHTRVHFDQLSFVFAPGDVVLSQEDGMDRAYIVYAVTGGRARISQSDGYPRSQVVFDALRGRGMRPRARDVSPYASDSDIDIRVRRRRGAGGGRHGGGGFGDVFNPLTLECFYLDYDGTYVAPMQETIHISPFVGVKDIHDLSCIPTRFADPEGTILQKLGVRGKKFFSMMGHKLYVGNSVDSMREDITGEVYIDPETGYSETGGWGRHNLRFGELKRRNVDEAEVLFRARKVKRRDPYLDNARGGITIYRERERERIPENTRSDIDDDVEADRTEEFLNRYASFMSLVKIGEQDLTEEQLQLLPHDIFGYVLRSRRWLFLAVDGLSDINKSDEARMRGFNDLVIPTMYRQMLLALVENHARGPKTIQQREAAASGHMDLVSGKGNGLIILLHGPPGAGKTSTAETIATYTKRPLYSITCGDIGTVPDDIEKNLEDHFRLANKWGCVLLLDEADVFMAKRDWHSMERNAAVSVFLRVLEYYSGILFLTTNRTGVIDEAFKSRIHVSLRYPSLDLPSTKQIWDNLLSRIERDNASQTVKIEFEKNDLLDFAEKHFAQHEPVKRTWNGRQIRNAFQTAIALGRTDRIKMLKRKGLTEQQAEEKARKKPGREKYLKIYLTAKNFEKIAQTAKDFEEYLHIVRGSDATIAKNESVRDDGYTPGGPPRAPEKLYPPVPDEIAKLAAHMALRPKSPAGVATGAPGWKTPNKSVSAASEAGESESSEISSSDSDD